MALGLTSLQLAGLTTNSVPGWVPSCRPPLSCATRTPTGSSAICSTSTGPPRPPRQTCPCLTGRQRTRTPKRSTRRTRQGCPSARPRRSPVPGPPVIHTPAPGPGTGNSRSRSSVLARTLPRLPATPPDSGPTLLAARDLVSPVPPERWDHSLFHDPEGRRVDARDCGAEASSTTSPACAAFFGLTPARGRGPRPPDQTADGGAAAARRTPRRLPRPARLGHGHLRRTLLRRLRPGHDVRPGRLWARATSPARPSR